MYHDVIYDDTANGIYRKLLDRCIDTPDHLVTNKKGEEIREMINLSLVLTNTENCFVTDRNMSLNYLDGELDFYLSGSPFLKDISNYSKFWNGVSDDGRSINSNYGKLLLHDRNPRNYTQFEHASASLKNNLESKKAVLTIYRDNHSCPSNDNPCTMYMQFLVRDNRLNMFVKMRSNDVWFGLPYDMPFFVLIQRLMLKELDKYSLSPGIYSHQAGSLHAYERNMDALRTVRYREHTDIDQKALFHRYIDEKVRRYYES